MDEKSDAPWAKVKDILPKLRGLDPAGREALLDEECAGDPELRSQIDQILDNYGSALEFFARLPDVRVSSGLQDPGRTFSDGEIVSERFRIVGLLGEGGMGEVYKAEDLVLHNEQIALKTLRASLAADERAIDRLSRELRLARRITHSNVCRVHDVHQHQTTSGARIAQHRLDLLSI